MKSRNYRSLLGCIGLLLFAGCGDDKFQVAPVSGVVRCNGQLLTAGLVVFEPVPAPGTNLKESGRSAAGVVGPDGSYVLSTYGTDDGAIVGQHSVKVFAPAPEDDDAPLTDANRYACGNAPLEKTVVEGTNVIDLELTHQAPSSQRSR